MRFLPIPRRKADELEAVIAGRRSPDVATAEIRMLAAAGRQVGATLRLPAPDPTWQAAMRNQLLTGPLDPAPAAPSRVRAFADRVAASARVAVATGTASAMLGTTGMVAAAAESVPGQLLHPIETATERARLLLSLTDAGDARLHLSFAVERMDELEKMAGESSRTHVAAGLVALDRHMSTAAATAAAIDDPALDAAVRATTSALRTRLAALAGLLPASQRPLVERSLAYLDNLGTDPGGRVPPPPLDEPDPTPPADSDAPRPSPPADAEDPSPSPSSDELVPPLPGPLDDAGTELEDLLRDLLDGLDGLEPSVDPNLQLGDQLDGATEDLGTDELLGG